LLGKDLEEEYIFFDEKGDRVHVLNGTAREIYLLCDGTRTTGEIAKILTERFSVDEPTAMTDVASLLEELVELELVSVE
jgi:pyrroloquinoline quinone biosynthesis protein D